MPTKKPKLYIFELTKKQIRFINGALSHVIDSELYSDLDGMCHNITYNVFGRRMTEREIEKLQDIFEPPTKLIRKVE